MMKTKDFLMIICVLVLILAVPAGAIEIIFQEGLSNALTSDYSGTADTFMASGSGGGYVNFGQGAYLSVGGPSTGTQNAILKWDISALQSLAGGGQYVKIHSAKVELWTRSAGYDDIVEGVDVHVIKSANHDWVEGAGGGDLAAVGEPCWYFRKVAYVGPDPAIDVRPAAPGTQTIEDPWSAAYPAGYYGPTPLEWTGDPWLQDGCSRAGFDHDPTVLANIKTVNNLGDPAIVYEGPFIIQVPVDAAQEWVYGNNPGLLLKCHDDAQEDGVTNFVSSEFNSPAFHEYRPKLIVTYTIETGDEPVYGDNGSIIYQVGLYNQFDTDANTYCPRYTGVQDATLYYSSTITNYNSGRADGLSAGSPSAVDYRYTGNAVIKWDISELNTLAGVGEHVVISKAYVEFTDTATGYPDDPNGFAVYAINPANADWQEGTKLGEPATVGDMTWNFREVTDGTPPWDGIRWLGGTAVDSNTDRHGCSLEGVDHAVEPIARFAVDRWPSGPTEAMYGFEVPAELVQSWLDDVNAGIVIKPFDRLSENGYLVFRSSDYAHGTASQPELYWKTYSNRPRLVLTYSVEQGIASTDEGGGAVFQDGIDNGLVADYQGTEDNFLGSYGSGRDYNNGQSGLMYVGTNPAYVYSTSKGILKWDLSALNTLAGGEYMRIDHVRVDMASIGTGYANQDADVVAIAAANADWTEGAQLGNPAQDGDSTWNYKIVNVTDPNFNVPWAGSVGLSTPGTDYDPTVITTLETTEQSGYQYYAFTIPNPVVQAWIDNPSDNAGLMFKTPVIPDASIISYLTSDTLYDPPYYAGRPKLSLTYTIGGDPHTYECTENIASDISGSSGDPDCYVDMYDYAAFASEWAEDETQ